MFEHLKLQRHEPLVSGRFIYAWGICRIFVHASDVNKEASRGAYGPQLLDTSDSTLIYSSFRGNAGRSGWLRNRSIHAAAAGSVATLPGFCARFGAV